MNRFKYLFECYIKFVQGREKIDGTHGKYRPKKNSGHRINREKENG